MKYLNVHHVPVCTTFYFIEGIEHGIVDATAKEEKLATSRLAISMNIFEDLCGMTTLGNLEIDPQTCLKCLKVALVKTKEITKLVRESFAKKGLMPLLETTNAHASRSNLTT